MLPFQSRIEAGYQLAHRLRPYAQLNPLVLAATKNSTIVAAEVARTLHAPLDLAPISEFSAPGFPDRIIGAVADEGEPIFEEDALLELGLEKVHLMKIAKKAARAIKNEVKEIRGANPATLLIGRYIEFVTDLLSTGVSVEAAAAWLKSKGIAGLIVAAPVADYEAEERARQAARDCVCLTTIRRVESDLEIYREASPASMEEAKAAMEKLVPLPVDKIQNS